MSKWHMQEGGESSCEVATGGADGFVRVWDARSLKQSAAAFPHSGNAKVFILPIPQIHHSAVS